MMQATQQFLHEEGCINFGVLLDSEPGQLLAACTTQLPPICWCLGRAAPTRMVL